jgi:hypothetical protein
VVIDSVGLAEVDAVVDAVVNAEVDAKVDAKVDADVEVVGSAPDRKAQADRIGSDIISAKATTIKRIFLIVFLPNCQASA